MAEDQKKASTPLTTPVTPPIVDSGVLGGTTLTGRETLKVIPDVNVIPGAEGIVKVEEQPDNRTSIEAPTLNPEPISEISKVPVPNTSALNQNVVQKKEPDIDNPKLMPIEKAREKAKSKVPAPQISGGVEVIDNEEALANLEVKTEEWRRKNAA